MDGAPGSQGRGFPAPQLKASAGTKPEQERHDIFVRAHTSVRTKNQSDQRWSREWPKACLILDTETTRDTVQKLNFGVYRRCQLVGDKYLCAAEGIFHKDDLSPSGLKILDRYKNDPKTIPSIEMFPARMTLGAMSRSSFLKRVFWKSVREGEQIVGFNLPFDLSRLATVSTKGDKGDWSLALSSLWKNPKTGKVVPNPKRPRILIEALNSKTSFIKLGSILHREEWPHEGRFLDLRTLSWSLRNVSFSLQGACEAFGVQGKVEHSPTGRLNRDEIEYCRGDVAAKIAY
jgi:hypothetical protein